MPRQRTAMGGRLKIDKMRAFVFDTHDKRVDEARAHEAQSAEKPCHETAREGRGIDRDAIEHCNLDPV